MERIFVQIPSYRDPELAWTIRDLFQKAAHPERISVGVCLQTVPEADRECEIGDVRPEQVRCVRYHARDSRGVCWARHLAQKLWEGEEFTLQIDSHMRFVQGWDCRMIAMLAACPSSKAVLSTYATPYAPPDVLYEGFFNLLLPLRFDNWGILLLTSVKVPLPAAPAEPILGAFCGAGFLFGPATMISDVPYDPYLYFFGEEITLAVRLWTRGWDIYHPNTTLVYHYWRRDLRPLHWDDVEDYTVFDIRSRKRIRHLLGVELSTEEAVIADLDRYGLGAIRGLEEYQRFSGVDFRRRSIARDRWWWDGAYAGARLRDG